MRGEWYRASETILRRDSLSDFNDGCKDFAELLAAARRIATRVARRRTGGVASAEDYRHALREVARAAIHGVDRNPLAVELTKVALLIETVEPGKPLGFLDANIRCGDSLLGVFDLDALRQGIPDAAYKPLIGDDKDTARYFGKRNNDEREGQGHLDFAGGRGHLPAAAPLADEARALRAMPEDSPAEIAAKRRRFAAGRADPKSWSLQIAADLYTAAFLAPKTGGLPANRNTVTIPTTAHVWDALAGRTVYGPLVGRAQDLADQARAFHWPLEFPDVMAAGGFDVLLGNPPWERIKLQEQEFFAAREPAIAEAPNAAARGRLIGILKTTEPGTRERALYDEFETAKRIAEATSVFARVPEVDSGRFPLTGRGDVNTYALFAELFANLAGPRGRAGVIVPTGIATDSTTAPFFAALIDRRRLAGLIDFENREKIFPAVDSRMKFSLLTTGHGLDEAQFAFFLTNPAQLAERERRFTMSGAVIALLNPNTKTSPVFRARADAELTAQIYARVPVLVDESRASVGNPWHISFHTRIWHMAEDSAWFRTAAQLTAAGFVRDGSNWIRDGRYVPLYEAKMMSFYDHRAASYGARGGDRGYRVLPSTTDEEHRRPDFEIEAYYWVPEEAALQRLHAQDWRAEWLLGWKDITASTNERTLVPAIIPRSASGDTFLLAFPKQFFPECGCLLLANWSSIVMDYVVRQKVNGLHLKPNVFKQFPTLSQAKYTEAAVAFIVPHVLELTYTSHSMAPFARDLGYEGPPFAWDEDRRALLRADLDAWYARAYGLTRDELRYILDPADVRGSAYPSETFRVLKKNEMARYGEYRTARLVLAAWDAQEARLAAAQ
jgi:hypothetical protein